MKIILVKGHMDKIFRETQRGLVFKCSCLKARYGIPASHLWPVVVRREKLVCLKADLSYPIYPQVAQISVSEHYCSLNLLEGGFRACFFKSYIEGPHFEVCHILVYFRILVSPSMLDINNQCVVFHVFLFHACLLETLSQSAEMSTLV